MLMLVMQMGVGLMLITNAGVHTTFVLVVGVDPMPMTIVDPMPMTIVDPTPISIVYPTPMIKVLVNPTPMTLVDPTPMSIVYPTPMTTAPQSVVLSPGDTVT